MWLHITAVTQLDAGAPDPDRLPELEQEVEDAILGFLMGIRIEEYGVTDVTARIVFERPTVEKD